MYGCAVVPSHSWLELCPVPAYLPPAGLEGEDILSSAAFIGTMSLNTSETAGPVPAKRRPQPCSGSPVLRHQCSFCPYASRHRASLVLHERVHTGERPFRCQLCSRGFAHRSHVVRHLRTHTGERPFRCPLCPAAFSQRSNVKVHLRSHATRRPVGAGNTVATMQAPADASSGSAALQM
ncbi:uncharacterized protein LOC144107009 [Amblyomma americanum]